jgi:hypothetical protein
MAKYEKLAMDENGNAVFQIIDHGEVLQTLKPENKGLWKSKEFYILFERVALNPQTLKNISAWFCQRVVYRVPNKDGFDFHWFYWEKGMLPHIRILDCRMGRLTGLTFAVNPSDATYVKKVNAPKRLTAEQKIKALMNGEFDGLPILGIFDENDGAQFVSPKSD